MESQGGARVDLSIVHLACACEDVGKCAPRGVQFTTALLLEGLRKHDVETLCLPVLRN